MKKKLTLFFVALMGVLSVKAQGVIVHKTDGTQIKVPLEMLDSITVYPADDVTPQPNVDPIEVNDLTGEWEDGGLGFSRNYKLTFSGNQVTVKQGDDMVYQGNYTLSNNVVSFTMNGTTYKSAAGLAGGKSVLIMKNVSEDGSENLAFILVKKGKTINTKKEDIQGDWLCWETFGDEGEIVRMAYMFSDNNFEMIITPWGQRYTGTYTYEGGIVKLEFQQGYTSREEGTGYGSLWGDMNPITLECDWKPLYQEHWPFDSLEGPFFVVGDEAFAGLMMPSICTKRVP